MTVISWSRHPRRLTAEERRLWAHVARGVTPLGGRSVPAEEAEPAQFNRPASQPHASEPVAKPSTATLPPLAPLERRTRTALRRGTQQVEDVVDLHGLRQSEAHAALLAFLRRSQTAGRTLVLVITGKGAAGCSGGPTEERGVLRRMVPHWLRLPDLRTVVLGFEEAAPHHGGSGALYVRLRRGMARHRPA